MPCVDFNNFIWKGIVVFVLFWMSWVPKNFLARSVLVKGISIDEAFTYLFIWTTSWIWRHLNKALILSKMCWRGFIKSESPILWTDVLELKMICMFGMKASFCQYSYHNLCTLNVYYDVSQRKTQSGSELQWLNLCGRQLQTKLITALV